MQNLDKDRLWELSEELNTIAIPLVKKIQQEKHEFTLSLQFLRSTTSISANYAEARVSQSRKDFIMKMSITRKECSESLTWVKCLQISGLLTLNEINLLNNQLTQIFKLLNSSISTAKKNLNLQKKRPT